MKTLLERHFDTAFDAPDGIKRLRELILSLAMQGKLVKQDPSDPPASELLKEIEAEKKRLIKAGKIKQPKPLPPIKPEEVPYELPKGWAWVRLDNVSEVTGGFAFKSSKYTNNGVRVIRISDFDERGFKNDKIVRYMFSEELRNFELKANDILMAMTGGTVGKSLLVKELPEPMVVNQRVATISILSSVIPEYLYSLIQSNIIQCVIQNAKNSTNDNISMVDITGFHVPLPPLAEQHRIVAKIDQLMARCDALENLRAERDQKRLVVHAAAIRQLLDPASLPSRPQHVQPFLFSHFPELYAVKENVTELRKAILQLAVMGKLVTQDSNDPPASELLKEIRLTRSREAAKGKAGKIKELLPIKPEEIPYELPKSWEWVRVSDLVDVGTGSTPSTTNREYYNGTIPWYTSSATNKAIADTPETFITEKAIKETNCKIFPSGSLIIALYGQGKTRGQISEIVTPGATNQAIAAMVFNKSSLKMKSYMKYFFIKIYEEIRLLASGAAQPNLNVGKIKDTLFPLPPLAEQHRIVAKIDQLMALCDAMENQITSATAKQTTLLTTLMARV
jgi:type I restriction enzyme S subunit